MGTQKYIFALGFFDGVHLGHQALLRTCVTLSEQLNVQPAVITFSDHPQTLLTAAPLLINTTEQRQQLLLQFGIRDVILLPTTKEVMSTNWKEFLAQQLCRGAAGFVCGDDFRFGFRGEGDSQKLEKFCRELGLYCSVVPEQTVHNVRISSTHIRNLLESGQMEEAVCFLGHPHIISGKVAPGRQIGRTIGIPTANLTLPGGVVCPRFGVYACKARTQDGTFLAVTNVGTRPTVDGQNVTVEPWLLDYQGDLYGKELTLEFYAFLRPEKKFDSLEALQEEIQKNARQTREFFEKN